MTTFDVQDMTCNHCVGSITKAVKAADPAAQVHTDLGTHRVQVESTLGADALARVIKEAGFTPKPVAAA